jgi:hypothetical protein
MRIRTVSELMGTFHDAISMLQYEQGLAGYRLMKDILEHLGTKIDAHGQCWLVYRCEPNLQWLGQFESEDDSRSFVESVETMKSDIRALKSELGTEDFPGEYSGATYARSKVFKTAHFLTAINRLAERVQTGADDPTTGRLIVDP